MDNSQSQCFDWTTRGASTNTIGGNNTQDKIFLLSYAEANKYFNVTDKRWWDNKKATVLVTDYVGSGWAYNADSSIYGSNNPKQLARAWYLRSLGEYQNENAYVNVGGPILSGEVDLLGNVCIRPALWVNLESLLF